MKTKESLFSYIEILEQQVQELSKRLEICEQRIMRCSAIDFVRISNLDKNWWDQDPFPEVREENERLLDWSDGHYDPDA